MRIWKFGARGIVLGAALVAAPAQGITIYFCPSAVFGHHLPHLRPKIQTTPCQNRQWQSVVTVPTPPNHGAQVAAQGRQIAALKNQLAATSRSLTAQVNQKNAQVLAAVESLDKRLLQDHVVKELTAKITAEVTQRYESEFALLRQEIIALKAERDRAS